MVIKHQGRNIKPDSLNINKFSGYNIVDDPSNLPSGYLVAGSKNVDLTRERGSLGKALGRAALITSVGTGGTTGMFTYQKSSGDIPLFGWGNALYKLTGTPLTVTKTTTAEFNAGTLVNAVVESNSVRLNDGNPAATDIEDVDTGETFASNIALTPTNSIGQTFTTGADVYNGNISKISLRFYDWDAGESITMRVYTDDTKVTELGATTVTADSLGFVDFAFSPPIQVAPSTQYYFELTLTTGTLIRLYKYSSNTYSGGTAYLSGVAQAYDLPFKTYCKGYYSSGTYTSESIDLGQTPTSATLSFGIFSDTPTAPTLADSGVAGNPDGTYKGKVVFVDSAGNRSGAGPESNAVSLTTNKISWTNIPVGGAGQDVAARELYRTNDGGTTFYLIATISDNSTTTYTDNIADSTLARHAPPTATLSCTFQARGSGDNTNWGDWQNVLAGGSVPRKRFVQVKAALTTSNTAVTSALANYTISYTTAYDTASPIPKYTDEFSSAGRWVLTATGGTATIAGGVLTIISNGVNYAMGSIQLAGLDDGAYSIEVSAKRAGAAPSSTLNMDFNQGAYDGTDATIAAVDVGTDFATFTKTFVADGARPTAASFRIWTFDTAGYIIDSVKIAPLEALSGSRIRGCTYDDEFFFTDGGRPKRYDGTNTYDVGIDPPTTAPSGAQGTGTGIGAGTYLYKIAYLNDIGGESALGPASGGVTIIANKSINLTGIPVSPSASVTGREIYRTKAGGTDYFFVAAISDNTTTTYTDTTADAALITPPESDVGLPPLTTSIVYEHKNYMMYANGNAVWFSKVGEPDHVAPSDYKQFPGNVLAMCSFQGALIVGGDNFCHAVFGDIWDSSPLVDDTTVKVVSNSFGPVSHESMQLCNSAIGDILVFPTRRGLSYINQGYQENTVANSILSAEVQPMFDDAISRENMAGMYYNYEYILAMNYAGAETPTATNNLMMKYDLRENKWNPPIYYGLNGITEAAGMLLGGSSTAGIVYQLNSGNTDATADIHAVAVLSPLATRTKSKFNRARLRVNDGSTTDTLELKPNVDGVEGTIAVGATSTWSVGTVSPKFRIPCPRGYELQVKVEDDSTNDWIIPAIEVDYEGGVM